MAIKVESEPDPEPPFERCCFCRMPTQFWFKQQVAVCRSCAGRCDERDVPTKQQWFRREEIANGRLP